MDNARPHIPYLDPITVNQLKEQVQNWNTSRDQFWRGYQDPRRDLAKECGYPLGPVLDANVYRELYDADPIAARVVELMPKECWSINPTVYEDEDSENVTEFEQAWDDMCNSLRGEQSWFKGDEGNPLWDYMKRLDILSGIGFFGVLLIGFSDGKNLDQPVDGVVSLAPAKPGKEVKTTTNAKGDLVTIRMRPGAKPRRPAPTHPTKELTHAPMVYNATSKTYDKGRPFPTDREADSDDEPVGGRPTKEPTGNLFGGSTAVAPTSFAGAQGTEAQYTGVEFSPPEFPSEKPSGEPLQLTFLRPFDESLVQIVQYEADLRNPRFGQPVMYRITLNDPRQQHSGVGLPMATVRVHWSRLIHVADNRGSSEIFGYPRLQQTHRPVLDSMKIRGSSPEGYWRSCFTGLSFETHPQLGGDVEVDRQGMAWMINAFNNTMTRDLVTTGMSVKSLAPSVVDPTPHEVIAIESICIKMECPVRVFKGSERGELASTQDDSDWNGRVDGRCNGYCTPILVVQFTDRMISAGVLPEPKQYYVQWPDRDATSDKDKAAIMLQRTQAYAAYVSGNVESVMPPKVFMTNVDSMTDEQATNALDEAKKATEDDMMTMPAPGELGHPATPQQPPEPIAIGPDGKKLNSPIPGMVPLPKPPTTKEPA